MQRHGSSSGTCAGSWAGTATCTDDQTFSTKSKRGEDAGDSNHDGKGDACQPDLVKPRVKVSSGSARRGQRAYIKARVADDRGMVRLSVTLSYRSHTMYRGAFGWTQTRWSHRLNFYTRTPLARFLPTGVYQACVKAWDKAGNHALGCSRYLIR